MSELEIIRHGRINGITVFFNSVEYRTPHFHPEWELVWVVEGTLLVHGGQKEERYERGELCLLPPKRVHAFFQGERPVTFLCLQISPQAFSFVFPKLESLTTDTFRPGTCLTTTDTEDIQAHMRALAMAYFSEAACFELCCMEHCAHIMELLLERLPIRSMSTEEIASADRRNARLDRFVRYVAENYGEKPSLEAFAREEHCSVSYMSRFLRSNLDQSFQEYVESVRFHRACRLIDAGAKRMIDVCESAGFSDYRYFSRCFKQHCGMTPEEYRRTRPAVRNEPARRDPRSSERIYTREESLQLLRTV